MRVEVVDNVGMTMAQALTPVIEGTKDLRIAVAFASKRGLDLLEEPLAAAINAGSPIEFLVGLDFGTTEPKALEHLLGLSRRYKNVSTIWLGSLSDAGVYHPKVYLSRVDESVAAIVGSSNLTEGGLRKNVEVNVLVSSEATDEFVSEIYATYNQLKFHPERVVPDDEYLALYTQRFEVEKRERTKWSRGPALRKLREAFVEKEKSLPAPTPTKRDLVGWLELVYDAAPDGEFTNQDIYRHEAAFRERFPNNKHVREKARQQLQFLRDMGFVEGMGAGLWRKL